MVIKPNAGGVPSETHATFQSERHSSRKRCPLSGGVPCSAPRSPRSMFTMLL